MPVKGVTGGGLQQHIDSFEGFTVLAVPVGVLLPAFENKGDIAHFMELKACVAWLGLLCLALLIWLNVRRLRGLPTGAGFLPCFESRPKT